MEAGKPSLRERSHELARQAIMDAFAAEVAEVGLEQLNLEKVAVRAGLSPRTLYRYHASRDELLEAFLAWHDEHVGLPEFPTDADELPIFVRQLFRSFDEHPSLYRAKLLTRIGRAEVDPVRRRRVKELAAVLRPVTSHLADDDARQVEAAVAYLCSSLAWMTMADESGLDGPAAGEAAAAAVTAIIDAARSRNDAAGRGRRRMARS